MRNLQSFVFIQKSFLESELSQAAADKKGAVEKSVLNGNRNKKKKVHQEF